MQNLQILHAWTEDGLFLQGFHRSPESKDTCIVCIHGMSGNILENYFGEVLGEELSENGYGFIYGHNRGYGRINDIRTQEIEEDGGNKTREVGAIYERFDESIYDIELWVNEALKLGYQKIILMGHSLGCNKVIHYLATKKNKNIIKVIFASPPDMVGLTKLKKYQPNYLELLEEAKKNIQNNKPRKKLTSMLWDWDYISSQTFLDLFEDHCPADNLPLLRNPDEFSELAQIDIPIFAFMGENDDITIRSLEEDLQQIKEKAVNCPNFDTAILAGSNHVYGNREIELAEMILNWLK